MSYISSGNYIIRMENIHMQVEIITMKIRKTIHYAKLGIYFGHFRKYIVYDIEKLTCKLMNNEEW